MAVQKSKKSPSRRGQHRAHDHLTAAQLSTSKETGEVHLPHHISPSGMYKGKRVIAAKDGE